MSQDTDWTTQDAKNTGLDDTHRIVNILDYLVKKRTNTINYKQAFKSILINQVQIELAFQSAKYDVIYANSRGNNALSFNSKDFSNIENNFKKLRNINVIIELCRACGMFQHEEEFFNALLTKEFESENKQNSLLTEMEKMMIKTLDKYVSKLNRAEMASKREKE